jgi:hypothetical protein
VFVVSRTGDCSNQANKILCSHACCRRLIQAVHGPLHANKCALKTSTLHIEGRLCCRCSLPLHPVQPSFSCLTGSQLPCARCRLLLAARSLCVCISHMGLCLQVLTSVDGLSWQLVGTVGPMWWPQVFKCKSGVYVIGNQAPIDSVSSASTNNLFISKMLDSSGASCAPIVSLLL